jgi:hypothetical protein
MCKKTKSEKREKRKKPRMKISGKSVFKLRNILGKPSAKGNL